MLQENNRKVVDVDGQKQQAEGFLLAGGFGWQYLKYSGRQFRIFSSKTAGLTSSGFLAKTLQGQALGFL